MDHFKATHSKHGVFCDDLIITHRKTDSIIPYLDEVCRTISRSVPNITYLGYSMIDERVAYPSKFVQLYDSYTYCIQFIFKLEGTIRNDKNEVTPVIRESKIVLKIPTLLNNYYYFINGVKFYPIYQFTDATVFHKIDKTTKDEYVVLKTILTPISLGRSATIITDTEGKEHLAHIFKLNMFRHKINLLALYFAKFGFFKSIKYFEGDRSLFAIVSPDQVVPDENFVHFQINKTIYLRVAAEMLQYIIFRDMTATIIDSFKRKITVDEIVSDEYWGTNLTQVFIKNGKGRPDSLLSTFERLYDSITRSNVNMYEGGDRRDIYAALKWMAISFNKIIYRDNNDVRNKRIRLAEYQITPLVQKINSKLFKLLSSMKSDKFDSIQKYEDILTMPYSFNPDKPEKGKQEKIIRPSDILIKSIINNNNTKYADCVNDLDLFNVALRWTVNGPSANMGRSKPQELTLSQRDHSMTFMGVVSMNTTSASEPGGVGVFTPFVKVKDGKFI